MSEQTTRRNGAITAGRLFSGSVENPEVERCHHCGELLHPYPEPEYWMQYPLPECNIVDDLKFCGSLRKPGCVDAYLAAHPEPAAKVAEGGTGQGPRKREKRKTKDAAAGSVEGREDRAARIASLLPSDPAALLDVAAGAVRALHAAVLAGDAGAAAEADERYEAVLWKMNGGRFFGCLADENSSGRVIERHCRATPGAVPLWGQSGAFAVTVNGMRAIVKVSDRIGSRIGTNHVSFEFRAVDLDRPFISETGYRSHYDALRAGFTVDQVATAILAELQKGKPKLIEADYRDRLAGEPVAAWVAELVPPPRREPCIPVVPEGFTLVDVVLPAHRAFVVRKWAAEAKAKIKAAKAAGPDTKEKQGEARSRDPASPRPTMSCSTTKGDDDERPRPARWAGFKTGDKVQRRTSGLTGTLVLADDGLMAYMVPDFLADRPNPQAGEASAKAAGAFAVSPDEVDHYQGPARACIVRNAAAAFGPGQRCEIVSVHHPVFAKEIGKRVIITKVCPDTRQVFAHEDRPVTYKLNRAGRRVVDSDPRCIQSIYGFEQLRVLI